MKRLALCPLVALVLAGCQDSTQPEVGTRVGPRPSPVVAATSSAAHFAYVTNAFSNSVSVIETAGNTVVATVGVGSFPAGVAITPQISPQRQMLALIDAVMELNLSNGLETMLDAKLAAAFQALADINQNNNVAAINSLQAFINAVEAQRGKTLSDGDATALIAAAQAIVDLLSV